MEDLIAKFNENKMLMDQWKKSQRDSLKIVTKKKVTRYNKDDIHVVT